jgi:Tfp pilus assembly protein PilZ
MILFGADQRRSTRYPMAVATWLQVQGESNGWGTTTVDMSEGGAQYVRTEPIDAGAHVTLQLQLEGRQEPMACAGTVSWANGSRDGSHRFGVGFDDIGAADRNALRIHTAKWCDLHMGTQQRTTVSSWSSWRALTFLRRSRLHYPICRETG